MDVWWFPSIFYIKIWGSHHHPIDSHPFINGWGSLGFQVVPCRSGTSTSWRVISPINCSYFFYIILGWQKRCATVKRHKVEDHHSQIGSLPPGIRVKMKDFFQSKQFWTVLMSFDLMKVNQTLHPRRLTAGTLERKIIWTKPPWSSSFQPLSSGV